MKLNNKQQLKQIFSLIFFTGLISMSCANINAKPINSISSKMTKNPANNNPLLPNIFCADPTSVEYDGRLYVYGTNDHEMYQKLKANEDVNYGYIKTLAVMSTDDMVNWTYHGEVPVCKTALWAGNSWAPSIVSRVEEDGLTHFYLYFANGGDGIGVLTSTSPVGPWKDPLGKRLISRQTPGLGRCDWLFDPGVVIDDNGDGWITFGGSGNPDCNKIAKLGKDMISLASEIVTVPNATDHFEANELNFMNGTYVWSYCTKWGDLKKSSVAAIASITSKTPLDASSWEYKGDYFLNQSTFGLGGGNNHTHLQKFNGQYYLVYQAHDLHSIMGVKGDCRNINIDKADVDEKTATIKPVKGTKQGANQIKLVDSSKPQKFSMLATGGDFKYNKTKTAGDMTISATTEDGVGAWTLVKGVKFDSPSSKIIVNAKGSGTLKICIDSRDLEKASTVKIESKNFSEIKSKITVPAGEHNIYFVFTNGIELDSWYFDAYSE